MATYGYLISSKGQEVSQSLHAIVVPKGRTYIMFEHLMKKPCPGNWKSTGRLIVNIRLIQVVDKNLKKNQIICMRLLED